MIRTSLIAVPKRGRVLAAKSLYLAALVVLSVAAGALLRHPAAAIAAMMAVVLVLPVIAQALPDSWHRLDAAGPPGRMTSAAG